MCQNMMGNGFYCKGLQICSEYIICTLLAATILTRFFDQPTEDKNVFNDTHREGLVFHSIQYRNGCF